MVDPILKAILAALYELLEDRHHGSHKAVGFEWRMTGITGCIYNKEKGTIMYLTTNDKKAKAEISVADKFGQKAKIDGIPAWSISDDTLGTLAVSEDGLTAVFEPSGLLGIVQVNVVADADLGEGVKTIAGTGDIQVEAGEAVSINLSFSAA